MAEKKKFKILIATGIYPPDIGGPATYARALERELPKLGCEIKVITYSDDCAPAAGRIYRINRQQNILGRYFKYFWQVFRLSGRFDLIYILDLMSAGLPAIMAAKLRRKKIVFRTGGDFLWEKASQSGWTDMTLSQYYRQPKKRLAEKILLALGRWLLGRVDLIIFSTKLQAGIYHNYYRVPAGKIRLIPNAVPRISAGETAADYGDCLVFAGRLVKLKNIECLVEIFGELKREDLKLLIFGQGPEKERLEKLIGNKKLAKRVKLMGNFPHDELIKIIKGCKFVLLPSSTEISPNLALECLGLAKPIILTRETGLEREWLNKMILVNPRDKADIKEKIEFLLRPDNLSAYERALADLKIKPRGWADVAREHDRMFGELAMGNEK